MKYVSIDLETTGLDSESCQIIEFGAVYDDLSKSFNVVRRVFHRFVRHPVYTGEPYALAMNQKILYTLAKNEHPEICDARRLAEEFHSWLYSFDMKLPIVAAGKNFAGFDKPFLGHVPGFNELVNLHHRCLDPGSMYFDPTRDEVVPSTQECLRRAGLDDTVAHTAVEDAMDVCRLIRWKLLGSV
jgi:DNA polymerase III epsilon subunit-like protein